jgi:ComF family protein
LSKKRDAYKKRVSLFVKPSLYLIRGLVDFVYPPVCFLCDGRIAGSVPLCRSCLKILHSTMEVKLQSGNLRDFTLLSDELHFNGVVTGWHFTPELEALIHLVKYQGMKRLGRLLGKMAGRAFLPAPGPGGEGIMVPVPLHRVRLRERGYNQSEWIARGMSEDMGFPVSLSILSRKKQTLTQTKLSAPEREKNVRDAFTVKDPDAVKDKTVFLVDDVITTGATLNACALCLKEAGAASVYGLALARPVKAV